MINFIQHQLDTADRLFEVMQKDHKERQEMINTWLDMSTNLIKKLDERDKTIAELRAKLAAYEAAERL